MLDTDICIYILRQNPPAVKRRFVKVAPGSVYVSAVTVAELKAGVLKSSQVKENDSRLEIFLSPLKILSFDYKAAQVYGEVRDELRRKGQLIGPYDMQIAAQARACQYTLVTNNTREFKRVKGLNIENWSR